MGLIALAIRSDEAIAQEEIFRKINTLAEDAHKSSGALGMVFLDPGDIRQPRIKGALPYLLLHYHVRVDQTFEEKSPEFSFVEKVLLNAPQGATSLARQLDLSRMAHRVVHDRYVHLQRLGYPVQIEREEDMVPFPGAF